MIGLQEIQILIADAFCNGNVEVAGVIMFASVLLVVFGLFRTSHFGAFAVMIPCTLVFSLLGVLSSTATVVMIVIAVLGLGVTAKNTVGE